MSKKYYDEFVGVMQKSITLKNELIPDERTKKYLESHRDDLKDEARNKAYPIVKGILDNQYKTLINDVLKEIESKRIIDWNPLGTMINGNKSVNGYKEKIERLQEDLRKTISKSLTSSKDYKNLFGKNPFGASGFLMQQPLTDEEKEAVMLFDKFSTFLTNYYKNRENFFTSEAIGVSVANRTVNENFNRHCQNVSIVTDILSNASDIKPLIIEKCKVENVEYTDILESYNGFNNALCQDSIDRYNNLVGIVNSVVNEYAQKRRNISFFAKRKNYMLIVLYKQILGDVNKRVIIDKYESDIEVIEEIGYVLEQYGAKTELTQKFQDVFNNISDEEGVYLSKNAFPDMSIMLREHWDYIDECVKQYFHNIYSGTLEGERLEKKIKDESSRKNYTIAELRNIIPDVRFTLGEVSEKEGAIDFIFSNLEKLSLTLKENEEILRSYLKNYSVENSLKEVDVTPIKNYFDCWNNIIRYFKLFLVDGVEYLEYDAGFYLSLEEVLYELDDLILIYNKIRNYVTQKPFSTNKVKLSFDNPTVGSGWSLDKERDYCTILLKKDNNYYLGVYNHNNKPDIVSYDEYDGECYEKMVYKLFKDISKMLPKCSTQLNEVKRHFAKEETPYVLSGGKFVKDLVITKEIYELNNVSYDGKKKWQKDYLKTGDEDGYRDATKKWCKFCMDFLSSYGSTYDYDYSSLRDIDKYESVAELYHDLDKILYKMEFRKVAVEEIEKLVDGGKLFLFKIYNKDFSPNKKTGSKKNLHTLLFEAIFSEQNAKEGIIRLNGGAEIFMRPGSIKNKVVHKAGEILVGKRTVGGEAIPDDVYVLLCRYYNNIKSLTEEEQKQAKQFIEKHEVRTTTRGYDIVKDKRYTETKYFFHVPIQINYKADGIYNFNIKMLQAIQNAEGLNVIGLDRGERNLVAYSVIDTNGNILEQGSFNTINGMNYQSKLTVKQKDRDVARKNWKFIENIKELKEGYVSQVIHQVVQLMEKYNAIVVMEDLNYGFKRGRFKVEKQVYQKFEMALINKLNYMVTNKLEGKDMLAAGGVLKGYQLSMIPSNLKDVGKQCGAIFYVPAGYTSKMDPTTGFVDVFDFSQIKNREAKKKFFNKFNDVFFDVKRDCFGFSFDYKDFDVHQTLFKTSWTVYSVHEKYVYDTQFKSRRKMDITSELKVLFDSVGVNYMDGFSKEDILSIPSTEVFWDKLEYLFKRCLQLRSSSDESEGVDRIVSPVLNGNNEFFSTPEYVDEKMFSEKPLDADTNGAYHIALKGLYLVKEKINNATFTDKIPKDFYKISNEEWFSFMQGEINE